jgi:hypothetical protein
MYLAVAKKIFEIFPEIASEEIQSVSLRKVYYLVIGRNAWHSTWVQHFYEKCISTNHTDLRDDAEKKRSPGTVFYIKELPVICLELLSGCLIVTEINTNYPLKNYKSRKYMAERHPCNYSTEAGSASESVFLGNRLSTFLNSLERLSGCWTESKRQDSVFELYLRNGRPSQFEDGSQYYAVQKSGSSGGSRNSLSWSISTGRLSDEYLRQIISPEGVFKI